MSEFKKEKIKFITLLLISIALVSISTFLIVHSLREDIKGIKENQQEIITILEK